uniref:Uncharacterized protein n=1 Tax=Parastrongyloides trichosuri TaxID=131310 RepID=A0A0N4ZIX5_PARTI
MSKIICSLGESQSQPFDSIRLFKEHVHQFHKCGNIRIGDLKFRCVQPFYSDKSNDSSVCKNNGPFTFTNVIRHYEKIHNFQRNEESESLSTVSSNSSRIRH